MSSNLPILGGECETNTTADTDKCMAPRFQVMF